MPLIQVDLDRDLFDSSHEALSEAIHQAQLDSLGVPADDLFQVFRPHGPGELVFSPTYGGVDRQRLVLIRITMVHMYPVSKKRELYEALVHRLGEAGVRAEDLLVSVVENGFEDWYAGRL
ncbi:tautomerase-like protein [Motilibacter peucedani]|uniref:Tautomerase-like protein n=1 Tax=Motilibacter peucedani TaxID=598650 RepID=A0A420XRN0_9ACTN|nr:tautomerase family protein [Motilibacter peucedani]RKS77469.1 tautomerase-like protein [Motilibacter peucedani]